MFEIGVSYSVNDPNRDGRNPTNFLFYKSKTKILFELVYIATYYPFPYLPHFIYRYYEIVAIRFLRS